MILSIEPTLNANTAFYFAPAERGGGSDRRGEEEDGPLLGHGDALRAELRSDPLALAGRIADLSAIARPAPGAPVSGVIGET